MQLTVVSIFIFIIALVLLYLASKLLLNRQWILGWLKGMAGLASLGIGLFALLAIVDLFSYSKVLEEETIATLSFEKVKDQHFKASLLTQSGEEIDYQVNGDQWQLDVRMLSWKGPFAALGVTPAVKLERLSGRYLSLEQERTGERSVYDLVDPFVYDYWEIAQTFPWFDAKYGSATFMPMVDGGIFEVKLTARGVLARPLNEVAKLEVENWN